jgi:hypothetical protein
MFSADVTDLLKSLEDYRNQVVKKLKATINTVMYEWSSEVIRITPLGDVDKYWGYYHTRENQYGWKEQAGLTRGNWMFGLNAESISFDSSSFDSGSGTLKASLSTVMHGYKLGDSITLGNATPYILTEGINTNAMSRRGRGTLEGGYSMQAPNGLKAPTLEAIQRLYKIPFDRF